MPTQTIGGDTQGEARINGRRFYSNEITCTKEEYNEKYAEITLKMLENNKPL